MEASGTGTLTYQWRFNGVDIAGAVEPDLTIPSLGPENVGEYTVVMSNEAGSVISDPAHVSVEVPFRIVEEPRSQALATGSTAIFTVRVSGQGTFTYQWQLDDVELAGATEATLALANASAVNEGSYRVVVSRGPEQLTSQSALLSVSSLPVISVQPRGGVYFAGQDVRLLVEAAGSGTLRYQWQLGGQSLEEANEAELILSNVGVSAAGIYSVIVSNEAGSVGSELAILTVREIISQVNRLTGSVVSPTEFGFRVNVPGGNQVRVQVSTDMVNWSDLLTEPVTGIVDIVDPNSVTLELRFYRVIIEPLQ